MARTAVALREAGDEDAAALAELWSTMSGRGRADEEVLLGIKAAIARAAGSTLERILVAHGPEGPVGAAHLVASPVSPVSDEHALRISHLSVSDGYDDSVALMFVEAAVDWAEDLGVPHVMATSASTNRDANRFLARLGLAQVGVLRACPTAALRARLPVEGAVPRGRLRSRQDRVVAARRSLRRQRATG